MGYQTEVQIGGPLRLPCAAAVTAVASTAAGRGVMWDESNANLRLCAVDDRVEFIVDEVHTADNEASVFPISADRNFRVRLAASPGTLAKGKLIKVDDSGAGLFALGGGAADVNVFVCEEAAAGNGAALARPVTRGITVDPVAHIADAVVAHDINAMFSDTEVEAALDALGGKINSILVALENAKLTLKS